VLFVLLFWGKSWVSFLTVEVPLPPLGRLGVKFMLGDTHVAASRPSKQVLPLVDVKYSFSFFFSISTKIFSLSILPVPDGEIFSNHWS